MRLCDRSITSKIGKYFCGRVNASDLFLFVTKLLVDLKWRCLNITVDTNQLSIIKFYVMRNANDDYCTSDKIYLCVCSTIRV
jgi:hypothetical protein